MRTVKDLVFPTQRTRLIFWLALVPIIGGAVWLARLPPRPEFAEFTNDGSYLVTQNLQEADPQGWELRRLDLRTGQTVRMPGLVPYGPFDASNDQWLMGDESEDGSLWREFFLLDLRSVRVLWRDENPQRWARWRVPSLLDDRHIMGIANNQDLLVVDFESGAERRASLSAQRIADLSRQGRMLVWTPTSAGPSPPARTQMFTAPQTPSVALQLMDVKNTLTPIATWNTNHPLVHEHRDTLFLFNGDTQTLQQVSVDDGSLLRDYDVSELWRQFPTGNPHLLAPELSLLLVWDIRQSRYQAFDFAHQKIVGALPVGARIWPIPFDMQDTNRVILHHTNLGLGVCDISTLETRWFHDKKSLLALKLHKDDTVLLALNDGSVQVIDAATGDLLKTLRSRAAVLPTFALVGLAFLGWCACWVRQSVKLVGGNPLIDAIVINGLVVTAFIVRVNLSGSMVYPQRLAIQTAEALGVSWMVLLMVWFVFGRTRWAWRLLAPLCASAAILAVALLTYDGGDYGIWQLIVGGLVFAILCGGWFRLMKWRGFATENIANDLVSTGAPTDAGPKTYQLLDLFLITAGAGCVLGAVRLVSPHMFTMIEGVEVLIIVFTASITGCLAAWAGLGDGKWRWRIMTLLLIVTINGSALPAALPGFRNWWSWGFTLKFQATVAAFTLATTLIYRAHGWRLRIPPLRFQHRSVTLPDPRKT